MLDYKGIFYEGVPAVANPVNFSVPFGAAGSAGFGWSNVNVVALGAEWRAAPYLTLRAGMEFNNNPVHPADILGGLFAPGVTTSQFSAGLSYRISPNSTIDLAGYYVPKVSISGQEVTPLGPTPFSNITASLSEAQVTIGWTYHFGSEAAVKATY